MPEAPDSAGAQCEEPWESAVGTAHAIEQPDVVRTALGRVDETGLLAFYRRTTIAEHANLDGRLPVIAAGRRSA